MEKSHLGIWVDTELKAKLKAAAEKKKRSLSNYVVYLLERYVKNNTIKGQIIDD